MYYERLCVFSGNKEVWIIIEIWEIFGEKQQQGLCVCGTVGGFEYSVDFSGNLRFL